MQDQGRFRGFPGLKSRKIKEQAVAFYDEHNITGALETLLNKMFLDEPEDVYGYMVCKEVACTFHVPIK